MKKKGAFEFDELLPWIIALIVIAIIVGSYLIATGRAQGIIDYIGNKLSFRG